MIRPAIALGLICATLVLGGFGMRELRAATPRKPITMVCTVEPGVTAKSGADKSVICETFRSRVEAATGAPVRLAPAIPAGTSAQWVAIAVTAPRAHALEVRMRSQLARKRVDHPRMAIDTMDKTLGRRDVDTLAQRTAKRLLAP